MPITVTLPCWMWERLVQILDGYPYSGAPEIVRAIKEQAEKESNP